MRGTTFAKALRKALVLAGYGPGSHPELHGETDFTLPVDDHSIRRLAITAMAEAGVNAHLYSPSPFVVGVFEFTMMRSAPDDDHRRRAALFQEYWQEFMAANFGPERRVALARTLPHEAALPEGSVEVLDYERASDLIGRARRFSVGLCSCRHEKHHLGEKRCSVPLESCTALDHGADYLIRNGLAREISREEMLELVERSRALGLVMNADNVRSRGTFICHCCSCCCNLLLGLA